MKVLTILFVIFVIYGSKGDLFKKKQLVLSLKKFMHPCTAANDLPLRYENVKKLQKRNVFETNYTLVVTEEIRSRDLVCNIDVRRCRGLEDLNSCMKFTSIKSTKLCGMVESENQVWSPFLLCLKPHLSCPFLKVKYVGTDCSFDMSRYTWFPLDGSYWKMNITVYDKNRLLLCALVEGTVKTVLEN